MFRNLYYEDYEVGFTKETIGRTITETDIVMNAGQTGDFFPHHMDAEWCEKNEFGKRIYLVYFIFSSFIKEHLCFKSRHYHFRYLINYSFLSLFLHYDSSENFHSYFSD